MTEQDLPKVLVVDDQRTIHMLFRARYEGILRGLHARTIDEARSLFETNTDIRIIIMDACVPGRTPTTTDLVQEFRRTFHGPIIGCSNDSHNLPLMRQAGCSHVSEKQNVWNVLDSLLHT